MVFKQSLITESHGKYLWGKVPRDTRKNIVEINIVKYFSDIYFSTSLEKIFQIYISVHLWKKYFRYIFQYIFGKNISGNIFPRIIYISEGSSASKHVTRQAASKHVTRQARYAASSKQARYAARPRFFFW